MLRLIINESTNFSNFILDKIYNVNRFDKKISDAKIFIASSNKIASESFTILQIGSTIFFLVKLFYKDSNLLGLVLASAILSMGLVYIYSERNDFYKKKYYSKEIEVFPLISFVFFLFLTILPLFLIYIQFIW
jgi:hypothetical protein